MRITAQCQGGIRHEFCPDFQRRKTNPVVSLSDHLAQLMQGYGYDQNDLNENRAGRVAERLAQTMKGLQRSKIGVLLLIMIVLIALPLLSRITSAIPPKTIVVSAIFVPILGIWLLVQLFRGVSPGKGQVMQVEGHFYLDRDAALRTGITTYKLPAIGHWERDDASLPPGWFAAVLGVAMESHPFGCDLPSLLL